MTLLMSLLVISFTLLGVAYLNSKRLLSLFKKKSNELTASLKQAQEEVIVLQHKLHNTLEDPVTHLLGRQLFEDRLSQSIKEGERYQFTMGVLFVDIDDFKTINQVLGKDVGDALLCEIAGRIQASIRKVDSASRFSDDMFAVLLSQLSKPEMAAIVAQRILQALNDPIQIGEQEIYATVSIGISIFPTDGEDVTTLLQRGSQALTLAKKQAKHSYQFYQEQMHENSERALMLHTSVSRESILNELSLYYVPVKEVAKNRIAGVEAHLHWVHPTLGLIQPHEIFNLAVKQNKLNDITEWMLHAACQAFLHYRAVNADAVILSVAVSIKQLESSRFIYRISQVLQDLSFNPEWLVLEIQNSEYPCSLDVLEKAFNMLQYLRIKVAINHFSSDAFSLRYLKNFPVQYLKLGPLLIDDMGTNTRSFALVKAVIFMAKSLSMDVIIHGVESEQQLGLLRELGCTLMAGPLLGKPLSETQLLAAPGRKKRAQATFPSKI